MIGLLSLHVHLRGTGDDREMHEVHALPMRGEHADGVLGLLERQRIRMPLLERIASGLDDVDLCSPQVQPTA